MAHVIFSSSSGFHADKDAELSKRDGLKRKDDV